ncbi:hypothetical protein HaLaN_14607 [Haematococcus lacustris]|uniref:Uncharacterized protein n=1 Tax=Haematococcus lacustris TaxID=44745 RepID=A0A699Z8I6_HAELA|nr:hypothetical protein HaLaN_14607 [Haematococcus lacustris]
MPPRKSPNSAEPEPHPIERPRNKVLAPLQANNARSEGLNGKPSADRSSKSRVSPCCAGVRKPSVS